MKKILFALLLFASFAQAQGPQTIHVVVNISDMKAYFGKSSRIHVTATNEDYILCTICTADESTIYAGVDTRKWKKFAVGGASAWGGITGTLSSQTDLNTALGLRLLKSDTAAMLSAYLAARHTHSNTTALNNVSGVNTGNETTSSINTLYGFTITNPNLKLNISDTGAMLSAYLSQINTNTAAIALKVNISDTAAMLLNYKNTLATNTAAIATKQNSISLTTSGTSGAATFVGSTLNIPQYSAGGGGDASTNTTSSVDGEVTLFSGTAGKTLKRATITGIPKLASGVMSAATAGTDYSGGTSALATGILKTTTSTGNLTIAVAGDFPTLNQSTTGSAATLTTPRAIYGNNFDGSAALTQIIGPTYGGTNNAFTGFTGPATSIKTFTLPNASATILTDNAAVTVAQGGTGAATLTGILKGNGTSPLTAATAGTDYTTPSSTETFTNKTFNADGTGNSITNIENADIKAAAAIAVNKLAAVTASRALVSDGSGFVSPATTTATEIGYVNGVTGAIQMQLNTKATNEAINDSLDANAFTLRNVGGAGHATMKVVTPNTEVALKRLKEGANIKIDSISNDSTLTIAMDSIRTHLVPVADNTYDLGADGKRIGELYLYNGVINNAHIESLFSSYQTASPSDNLYWYSSGGTELMRLWTNTGRLTIQEGGTYTAIPSAKLAINSTTEGFLPPRMTAAQRAAISSPATGLVLYDTDSSKLFLYNGSAWTGLAASSGTSLTAASAAEINTGTDNAKYNTPLGLAGSKYSFNSRKTNRFEYFTDFIGLPVTAGSGAGGPDAISAVGSGTGAAVSAVAGEVNRPGITRSSTGTTATGLLALMGGVAGTSPGVKLGGGQWVFETAINLAALSTSGQRYQYVVGFHQTTAANQTDGVYFLYDEGGVSTGSAASANWQCVTAVNSTRTFNTTSTAVAAATWTKLKIVVNAAATSVGFYVDDVLVQTTTTNIPTSPRSVGYGTVLVKSVGTTASTVDIDYLSCEADFTTPR